MAGYKIRLHKSGGFDDSKISLSNADYREIEKMVKEIVKDEIKALFLPNIPLNESSVFLWRECRPIYNKLPQLIPAGIISVENNCFNWKKSKKSFAIILHHYNFSSWKEIEKYFIFENRKPGNLKQILNDYLNDPIKKGKLPHDWDSISRFFPDITL